MKAHEEEHLKLFTELMAKHRVRPSLLNPVWGALGYALGSVTATFGINGAFLGTRAVEKVIVEHYNE
jgi:ubiquinone biosynthesis monooxygenase Coq7